METPATKTTMTIQNDARPVRRASQDRCGAGECMSVETPEGTVRSATQSFRDLSYARSGAAPDESLARRGLAYYLKTTEA